MEDIVARFSFGWSLRFFEGFQNILLEMEEVYDALLPDSPAETEYLSEILEILEILEIPSSGRFYKGALGRLFQNHRQHWCSDVDPLLPDGPESQHQSEPVNQRN